ncbi:hypothetical protein KCV04_g36, partial [Aureobasidium melanogenum]
MIYSCEPFLLFSGKTSFGGGVAFVASMTLSKNAQRHSIIFGPIVTSHVGRFVQVMTRFASRTSPQT